MVTRGEYSHKLASHSPPGEKFLTSWHAIGHLGRIFSQANIPLVTWGEYSHKLAFTRSHVLTHTLYFSSGEKVCNIYTPYMYSISSIYFYTP
jgi:hypothetical protein